MADSIQFRRGLRSTVKPLPVSMPGFIEDEDRLIVGKGDGTNAELPNKQDIDNLNSQMADIGDKNNLVTEDKSNIVNAINEVKTQASNVAKNNYTATAVPTATDDSSNGYSVGSTWLFNRNIYKCIDDTGANAVWVKIQKFINGAIILYVDQLNGNDDNVGTAEAPLKTLSSAINSVSNGKALVINLQGDYNFATSEETAIILFNRYVTIVGEASTSTITVPVDTIDDSTILYSHISLLFNSKLTLLGINLNFSNNLMQGSLTSYEWNIDRTFIRCGYDYESGISLITLINTVVIAKEYVNFIGCQKGANLVAAHGAIYFADYNTTYQTDGVTNFTKVSGIPIITTSTASIS